VKDKIILAIMLLLVSGCAATSGDGSRWKNMGPDQVHCKNMSLRCVVTTAHFIFVNVSWHDRRASGLQG